MAKSQNLLDAWEAEIRKQDASRVSITFLQKSAPEEERYTLGIVLEPTKELRKPDAQEDIYSAAEVRKAAFDYMLNSQLHKIQHTCFKGKEFTDAVKIVESYLAPVDMTIGGRFVAKGTWLMGLKYLDDDVWKAVKEGRITGYSIGGWAVRTPV